MKKERVMHLGLVKYIILKKFKKLNPDVDPEYLDWDNLDSSCCFGENYHDMANAHPEYVWFEESLEEIEAMENEQKIRELIANGLSKEEINKIREEMDMQTIKSGWKRGWIAGKETYIKTVPIKPHTKEKDSVGRIQTTCIRELVGLEAKITIVKPKEPYKESTELELNEYE